MLDFDLAELYNTQTKRLNQQVKRNISRFPPEFMFRLTPEEWELTWSQIVTTSEKHRMRSQIVTASGKRSMRSQIATASQKKRNAAVTPYAFTEHGITMLASVLNSDRAVQMNILIVKAFIALRKFAMNYNELAEQINEIRKTVSNHNEQLNQIYEVIENVLDEKVEQKNWDERRRIGFNNSEIKDKGTG